MHNVILFLKVREEAGTPKQTAEFMSKKRDLR